MHKAVLFDCFRLWPVFKDQKVHFHADSLQLRHCSEKSSIASTCSFRMKILHPIFLANWSDNTSWFYIMLKMNIEHTILNQFWYKKFWTTEIANGPLNYQWVLQNESSPCIFFIWDLCASLALWCPRLHFFWQKRVAIAHTNFKWYIEILVSVPHNLGHLCAKLAHRFWVKEMQAQGYVPKWKFYVPNLIYHVILTSEVADMQWMQISCPIFLANWSDDTSQFYITL